MKMDAKFYRKRWKAVEEIERQELRASNSNTNWQQLNSILRRSARMGLEHRGDENEIKIFGKWAAIKRKYESTKRP